MTKDASKWTPATINKLKELYLTKNYSASQIAQLLGFTKNAIIGKIHRLKLNEEKTKTTTPVSNTAKISQQQKGKISLDNIEYNMCVWPEEELETDEGEKLFLFCGEPVVAGKSYCKSHLSVVYLANKKPVNTNNYYKESDYPDEEETEEEPTATPEV